MLRWLVLLFALLNVALYFWLGADPRGGQGDRDPQRLAHQVAPDAIQVVPDLAAPGAAGASSPAAFGASLPATSAPSSALTAPANPAFSTGGDAPPSSSAQSASTSSTTRPAAAAPASTAMARNTSDAEPDCAESGPLEPAQLASLRLAFAHAGIASDALVERREQRPGTWMVYMGRFPDQSTWQRKADELKHMNLKFDLVSTPAAMNPGLSLGSFSSQADAAARLADLARHGVHTARVVLAQAPQTLHRLQVRLPGDDWRRAVGAQRFNACPAVSPTLL